MPEDLPSLDFASQSPTFAFAAMKRYFPMNTVDNVLSILSKISFLGGVLDEQRDEIFNLMEELHFQKGEYVSIKGEQPTHIHIIVKGKVDLLISNAEATIRKRSFDVGDCFGEAALLSMINNTASFIATEETDLLVLSRRALSELHRKNPALFGILIMNMARELARKLQYSDELMLKEELQAHATAAVEDLVGYI